ncbi:MAG: helix-turn-helix domain-containing protein [Candidatus Thorarchaeota archaeon]
MSEQKELTDLRRLLNLKDNVSDKLVIQTWKSLKKMQEELELPSLYPIKQHYYFYQKLEEICKALNLTSTNFAQLNQLYIEIITIRELLGLPETTPMSDILALIQKESLKNLASLDIKYDSLLLKFLLLHSVSIKPHSMLAQEQSAKLYDLDRVLFEILKAYGPLSRPELVQLTGVPRSTIYDSLERLILKGLVAQYSEKKSPVGRPTSIFDALK